jgi:hypothetical protein
MCSAGVAIFLRQRSTTVTVGFFADPTCADDTPNAYAFKLCDFYSSQFANVAAGRGLCNTWCAESVRTDEFVSDSNISTNWMQQCILRVVQKT